MHIKNLALVALVILIHSFASPYIYAQAKDVELSGTVKDETSGVLPGVSITVRETDTGATRMAVTQQDGHYTILELAPGNYSLRTRRCSVGQDIVLRAKTLSCGDKTFSWGTRRFPGGQDIFVADNMFSWRTTYFPGGQDIFVRDNTFSWRTTRFPEGQDLFLWDKTFSWRTTRFPGEQRVSPENNTFPRRTTHFPGGQPRFPGGQHVFLKDKTFSCGARPFPVRQSRNSASYAKKYGDERTC